MLGINITLAIAALYAAAAYIKQRRASLDRANKPSSSNRGPSASRPRPPQTKARCMGKNFYAILQLEKDASDADIKKGGV